MAVAQASDLAKDMAGDPLFRGVSFKLERRERLTLAGRNGTGKTTLLRMLSGETTIDGGQLSFQRGVRVALHDQRPPREAGSSLRDYVLAGCAELLAIEARLGELEQAMAEGATGAATYDAYASAQARLEHAGGYNWRENVNATLRGLGFGDADLERDLATFSGGELTRASLARALAGDPDLLLLDEPTANLDPGGATLVRTALRQVLDATGATMLLVEHRVADVLDLVDRVVVLSAGGGVLADGSPDRVFTGHGDTLAAQGVWLPGRTAVSRRASEPPGDQLISASHAAYRYPAADHDALSPVDITLSTGEAVCLTGASGSGKSTLALLLAGLARPTHGDVRATAALSSDARPPWRWPARDLVRRIGTVFQNPEHQFLTGRVSDELAVGPLRAGADQTAAIRRARELLERLHLAQLAEANPFTLSGGEQRRLSVATALATAPRMLVLDEPTFGQDARTWADLVALLADLRDGGAGLLVVTHDVALADALGDRELALDQGRLREPTPR